MQGPPTPPPGPPHADPHRGRIATPSAQDRMRIRNQNRAAKRAEITRGSDTGSAHESAKEKASGTAAKRKTLPWVSADLEFPLANRETRAAGTLLCGQIRAAKEKANRRFIAA